MTLIQSAEFNRKWTRYIKGAPTLIHIHQSLSDFSDNLEVISADVQGLRIQEFDR